MVLYLQVNLIDHPVAVTNLLTRPTQAIKIVSNMDGYNLKFAKLVENARETLGITQAQLAKDLNCSRATVSRLENGEHSISLGLALRIAKALQISIDSIIDQTDSDLRDFVTSKFEGTEVQQSILNNIEYALKKSREQK